MKNHFSLTERFAVIIYSLYVSWFSIAVLSWTAFRKQLISEQFAGLDAMLYLLALLCTPYLVFRSIRVLTSSGRRGSRSSTPMSGQKIGLSNQIFAYLILVMGFLLLIPPFLAFVV